MIWGPLTHTIYHFLKTIVLGQLLLVPLTAIIAVARAEPSSKLKWTDLKKIRSIPWLTRFKYQFMSFYTFYNRFLFLTTFLFEFFMYFHKRKILEVCDGDADCFLKKVDELYEEIKQDLMDGPPI